jgi:two-component system, NtrC family, sensor kinase
MFGGTKMTDQKVADNDLQEINKQREDDQSTVLFNAIFEAAQTGLLIIDSSNKQIMDVNPKAAHTLGHTVDEMLGEMIHKYMPPHRQQGCPFHDNPDISQSGILKLQNSQGHLVPVMFSLTSLTDEFSNLIVFSFLDISERISTENELRESHDKLQQANNQLKDHKDRIVQSEKLASIGQLAAGVAHEINNPVGYVTSNLGTINEYIDTMKAAIDLYRKMADMPLDDLAQRESILEQIQELENEEDLDFILEDTEKVMSESMEGVHRVAEIVQNLKSFAREDSDSRGPHNINDGIEAMIKMVWNELKYNCTIVREFGQVPVFQCHKGQINQVIMNMLVNASHAMPEGGGTITIGTSVVEGKLKICISDDGSGIPEEILPRIFDPFYTTKDVGKGTGLGLSISHGIILDHSGTIEVESEMGAGTSFIIYLPLTPITCGDDLHSELIG